MKWIIVVPTLLAIALAQSDSEFYDKSGDVSDSISSPEYIPLQTTVIVKEPRIKKNGEGRQLPTLPFQVPELPNLWEIIRANQPNYSGNINVEFEAEGSVKHALKGLLIAIEEVCEAFGLKDVLSDFDSTGKFKGSINIAGSRTNTNKINSERKSP